MLVLQVERKRFWLFRKFLYFVVNSNHTFRYCRKISSWEFSFLKSETNLQNKTRKQSFFRIFNFSLKLKLLKYLSNVSNRLIAVGIEPGPSSSNARLLQLTTKLKKTGTTSVANQLRKKMYVVKEWLSFRNVIRQKTTSDRELADGNRCVLVSIRWPSESSQL